MNEEVEIEIGWKAATDVGRERGVMQSLPPDLPEGIYRGRFVLFFAARNAMWNAAFTHMQRNRRIHERIHSTRETGSDERPIRSNCCNYLCIGFLRVREEHAR